ncbi:23S rRNA (guanosine(2251)-2'-O)-methyltransferase RlmB [Helicobacter cappadocius]|uniref:23S rRNA (Guanosine(2251)-2'-O)-methyltransferase RlmB n=1 Tax=Helicobacter cappadocius TaxID=3063998 RepID=A0AA90PV70_9HELI|nr:MULTISPECIES: 23S rRNA (guanosine(2251)-2'-O)-methyltransferase RlmB [unclassified Helicobacter]MDO7252945.1 23S rRNA (guanosine(2251)-2'-O)-methyltransferase RlmB [Helicobacter sp. faydin-H75]MDP2539065.1 23S rRNA (guanosine(2251)-2'-O)-methyltransferase RlmB [Helicobacter sp. faydin-H76]
MIVYGKQVVMYLLQYHPQKIEEIYLAKEIEPKLFSMMAKNNRVILRVDNKKAQALARGGNHQGFLAKIIPPTHTPIKDIKKFNRLLILCGITDVGNIGAIFRSAYCLGVEGIVLGLSESISYEGVLRSSVGAMLDIPFCISKNVLEIINELKNEGFCCYGADMKGENIQEVSIKNKWALFLGNEGAGLNRKILSKLDKIVSIKIKNDFNSLNVSVAAGILINRMC